MGSLFSTISGQFTKPLIIGSLFPSAIFLAACYFLVLPMVPWELHEVARLAALETQWKVVAITVAAVVLAFLLHVTNGSIIRLYEGYLWEEGPIGRFMKGRRRAELEEAIAMQAEIHPLRLRYKGEAKTADERAKVTTLESREREMIRLQWNLYPRASSVLPTRLGNTIRSFENYAERQYGFSGITFWSRFVAKIDSTYALALDDVKSSFDFVLNLSFLSAVLFFVMLLLGLAFPVPRLLSAMLFVQWIAKLLIVAAASWLFYLAVINRASEWGMLVRGAFDLYRRPVLQSLGFTAVPADLDEERKLWHQISRQITWGDRLEAGASSLRFNSSAIELSPANDALVLTRGVATAATLGGKKIVVCVANLSDADIKDVKLTETLPATRQLVWDSAKLDGSPATVRGTNPYSFEIGKVDKKSERELSYEVADG
jgi:hypothetical protein